MLKKLWNWNFLQNGQSQVSRCNCGGMNQLYLVCVLVSIALGQRESTKFAMYR